MTDTPNGAMTHIEQSQSQKEVTANGNFDRADQMMNTSLAIAMSDANLSLSAAQFWDAGLLEFTGTLTAQRTITLRGVDRRLAVYNNNTNKRALVFSDGGTTVTVNYKEIALLHTDGVNVRKIAGGNWGGVADHFSGFVIAPEDTSITLTLSVARAGIINSLVHRLATGSCVVAVKINGTNVTSLSAVTVGTTKTTTAATAANTFAAGDEISMTLSGTSGSPTTLGLAFSLLVTYTE